MTDNDPPPPEREPAGDSPAAKATPPARGRLAADKENGARIRADLDRVFTEQLLAQTDLGEAFTRELAAANMALPTLAEIDQTLGQLQDAGPSQAELEQLLAGNNIGDINVAGMRLNELLDVGITGEAERQMLRRGFLFLKRKKYAEATEWWRLNRPEDELLNSRLHLLLTLLLAFTYKLSGNEVAAQTELGKARMSRLFIQHK